MKNLKLHRFPNDLFPFHRDETLSGQILRAGQARKITSNFIDRITLAPVEAERHYLVSVHLLNTRVPFVPPKPNELESATSICALRAVFGT